MTSPDTPPPHTPPTGAPSDAHTRPDAEPTTPTEPVTESAPAEPVEPIAETTTMRKVLNGLGAVVAICLAFGVLILYYSNTSDVEFIEAIPVVEGEPGTNLAIELPADFDCSPQFTTIYRASPLGRWQQTHTAQGAGFTEDRREMWSTSVTEPVVDAGCNDARTLNVVLPQSGLGSDIAICQIAEKCVRVSVDR